MSAPRPPRRGGGRSGMRLRCARARGACGVGSARLGLQRPPQVVAPARAALCPPLAFLAACAHTCAARAACQLQRFWRCWRRALVARPRRLAAAAAAAPARAARAARRRARRALLGRAAARPRDCVRRCRARACRRGPAIHGAARGGAGGARRPDGSGHLQHAPADAARRGRRRRCWRRCWRRGGARSLARGGGVPALGDEQGAGVGGVAGARALLPPRRPRALLAAGW